MKEYKYIKKVDPEKLHKQIANAGFKLLGVVYDSKLNQATIMLEDSETKDPTSLITSYVYVEPVNPDYPVLYANAQKTVDDSLDQYNSAVSIFQAATQAWNSAATSVAKINASEQQILACASAIQAAKEAIGALVDVVTVLAKNNSIVSDDE